MKRVCGAETCRREAELSSAEPYSGERLHRYYSFGDFTLDLELDDASRRRRGLATPKSFDVLAYLVRHHGR